MKKRLVLIAGWVMILALLAACGSGEQKEGVELKVAGASSSATDTPSAPEPTLTPEASRDATGAQGAELSGRLLILRGGAFELYDLATGEKTPIAGARSYSPAFFSAGGRYASYSAFPNFGVLDIESATATTVANTASNPTGFGLSPDGQWMVIFTGQITSKAQVAAVDGTVVHNVAASSTATFSALWTPDSQLIWWRNEDKPEFQLFDPVSGESLPLGDADPVIAPPQEVAPDGTRAAAVPIAFRPADPAANPDACFDSYVELLESPFVLSRMMGDWTLLWTENGLVASSPHWLDSDRLLFVKLGTGSCGEVQGKPDRMVMLIDTRAASPQPQAVAGPLGNADDTNDPIQAVKTYGHLYTASPDGRYIAWIGGGRQAQESAINITDLETGATVALLRSSRADAADAADYIENFMFRQVLWLE